jgi:hypothetical protein
MMEGRRVQDIWPMFLGPWKVITGWDNAWDINTMTVD